MSSPDLILNSGYTPVYEEICEYIEGSGRALWEEMNSFVREKYKASPRIDYSSCSAKPGWNVKYKKSGKSLCTLYPEKNGFVALVVISLDLADIIEGGRSNFDPKVINIVKSAKPFNGTLWLMIPVYQKEVLESVKHLLCLKYNARLR